MIRKTVLSLSFLAGVLMGVVPFAGADEASEPGKKAVQSGEINAGMREAAIQRLKARGIEPAQYNSKLLEALAGKSAADVALAKDLILGGANLFAGVKEGKEVRARRKLATANKDLLELFRRDAELDVKVWSGELEKSRKKEAELEATVEKLEKEMAGAPSDARKAELEAARAMSSAELEAARAHSSAYAKPYHDARLWKMLLGKPQGEAAVNALIVQAREAALEYVKAVEESHAAADKAAAQERLKTLDKARAEAMESAEMAIEAENYLTGKSYAMRAMSRRIELPDGGDAQVLVPMSPQQAEELRLEEKVYKGVDAGFFADDIDLTSSEQVMGALRGLGITFPKGCSASYNPKKRTLKVVTTGAIHKDVEKLLTMYKGSKRSLEEMPGLSLTSGKLRSDANLYVLFLIPKESIAAHKSLDKVGKDKVKKDLARISKRLRQLQKRGDVQFVWVVEEGANKTELKKLLMDPLHIKGAYMTYESDSKYVNNNFGGKDYYGIMALDGDLQRISGGGLDGPCLDAIDEWVKKNPASK